MNAFALRLVWYVGITAVAAWVAGGLGASYFDSICDPNDPEVTECDLAGAYAILWTFIAVVGCFVLAAVSEIVLAVRRRRSRPAPSHDRT